jgi:hypothetical protein
LGSAAKRTLQRRFQVLLQQGVHSSKPAAGLPVRTGFTGRWVRNFKLEVTLVLQI